MGPGCTLALGCPDQDPRQHPDKGPGPAAQDRPRLEGGRDSLLGGEVILDLGPCPSTAPQASKQAGSWDQGRLWGYHPEGRMEVAGQGRIPRSVLGMGHGAVALGGAEGLCSSARAVGLQEGAELAKAVLGSPWQWDPGAGGRDRQGRPGGALTPGRTVATGRWAACGLECAAGVQWISASRRVRPGVLAPPSGRISLSVGRSR